MPPSLIQGITMRHRQRIDDHMIRQPLGVVTAITPFNFPAMISAVVPAYALVDWQLLNPQAERKSADDQHEAV